MKNYPFPRLRDIAVSERPQERLERSGAATLSDSELLAMLLRSGSRELDVMGLSSTLLARAGSLGSLLRWGEAEFRSVPGIGRVKSLQLLAVMELARRMVAQSVPQDSPLDSAEKVYQHLAPSLAGIGVEQFWVLCLNRKNRLLKQVQVSSGTATASLVHPREAFREAIRAGASAVIAAHNHPSGDPAPSQADIRATRQLREASQVIDIAFLDHVILGSPQVDVHGRGYYSFAEAGIL